MPTRKLKSAKRIRQSFTWKKNSCDKKYFKSLVGMLDAVKFPSNTGEYIRPRVTRKKKYCTKLELKDCKLDDFHSGDKYMQIIIGRYMITSNCFTGCKNYFTMDMNKWSYFKNDAFIHHMLKNNFFYKKYNSLPLDTVFPIRIVISNDLHIPLHRMKKVTNFVKQYGYEFFKGKAISDKMVNLIIDKYPELTTKITKQSPHSHVVSRELCVLNQENLYFYIVKEHGHKIYKPYILLSEKPIHEINTLYKNSKYKFEYL